MSASMDRIPMGFGVEGLDVETLGATTCCLASTTSGRLKGYEIV